MELELTRTRKNLKLIPPRKHRSSLTRRNQHLAILNAIARCVSQSLEIDELLGNSLEEILRLTSVDCGAIFLWDDTPGDIQLMAYRGLTEEAARMGARMGLLDSSCGGVREKGQLVIVPDITHFRSRRANILKRSRIATIVHIPLTVKENILGTLCIGTHVKREFDSQDEILLTSIGNHLAIAIENARLYNEVQQKERLRGELFRKVLNAQEEERKRIARDLHDDTSQSLTALLFAAEVGQELKEPAEIRKHLNSMHQLIQHTMDGVHKVIFDLRPSMLDHLGLVPALRWFAKSRLEAKNVRVNIEDVSGGRRLPPEMETLLFRVIQEAITNIARHSMAQNATILVAIVDDLISVDVEDDGIGFNLEDVEITSDSGRGLGLMGMKERMELMGGDLQVDTAAGYGTHIHVEAPIFPGTASGE